eukprot:1196119-Pyramimonas_sp.AAC.1
MGHLGAILRPYELTASDKARRQHSLMLRRCLKDVCLLGGGPKGGPRALGTVLFPTIMWCWVLVLKKRSPRLLSSPPLLLPPPPFPC